MLILPLAIFTFPLTSEIFPTRIEACFRSACFFFGMFMFTLGHFAYKIFEAVSVGEISGGAEMMIRYAGD